MSSQYKLIYFNLRGRAELARLLFAVAGQEYEDFRFEREQWPEHKGKAPFGQAPFLEVTEGGKTVTIAQSLAIARFLARRFNLEGKSDIEKAEVDMYADQLTDLVNEIAKAFRETDEAKKKELEEKMKTEVLPTHLKFFETRLAKSSSGFLIGDSLTWVDLYLTAVLEWLADKKDQVLSHFAGIKAHDEKIRNLPKIAEWLAKRPVTAM